MELNTYSWLIRTSAVMMSVIRRQDVGSWCDISRFSPVMVWNYCKSNRVKTDTRWRNQTPSLTLKWWHNLTKNTAFLIKNPGCITTECHTATELVTWQHPCRFDIFCIFSRRKECWFDCRFVNIHLVPVCGSCSTAPALEKLVSERKGISSLFCFWHIQPHGPYNSAVNCVSQFV